MVNGVKSKPTSNGPQWGDLLTPGGSCPSLGHLGRGGPGPVLPSSLELWVQVTAWLPGCPKLSGHTQATAAHLLTLGEQS